MSNVDNRIVRMEFDNKQFESGVKETMTTLDRLKQALKLDNVTSGFDKLGKASDNAARRVSQLGTDGANSFGQLSTQLDTLGSKVDGLVRRFSVVGEAIHKVQTAFVSTIKEMTVGQISKGFSKYAETSEAISTLMGTLGKSAKDDIYSAIQDLNTYSDETSFDLANMTQNLSMFVNSGQELWDSVKAIKGIGNAAATAGVSVEKTRMIMKNFSDAMGAGSMRLQDWKSLEIFGFTSKPIREAFIETAKTIENATITKDGYVIDANGKKTKFQVNYQNFRDSLKYDWLNAEVIMRTLEKYQDLNSEFGREAYEAAKVARTYKEAMDAVGDAVSTGWMHVFERIFGDVDEASALWTSFSNVLIERLSSPFFEWLDNILVEWKANGGREKLIRTFSELAAIIFGLETELEDGTIVVNQNILSSIIEAWRNVFGEMTGMKLLQYTDKLMMAMIMLHRWMDIKDYRGYTVFDKIRSGFEAIFNVWGILRQVRKGIGTFNRSLALQLLPTVDTLLGLLPDINNQVARLHKWFKDTKFFPTLGKKLAEVFRPFTSRLPGLINTVFDGLIAGINFLTTNKTITTATRAWFNFFDTFLTRLPGIIENVFAFVDSIKEMIKTTDEFKALQDIYNKYIKPLAKDAVEFSTVIANALYDFLTFDTSDIVSVWDKLKARLQGFNFVGEWLTDEWKKLKELFPTLQKLEDFWNESKMPEKMQKLSDLFDQVFDALFGMDTSGMSSLGEKIKARFSAAWEYIQPIVQTKFEQLKKWVTEKATGLWTDISSKFSEMANPIFAIPIAGFAAAVFAVIRKITQPNVATSVAQGLAGSATSTIIGLFGAATTAAYLVTKIKPEHVEKVLGWYEKLKEKLKEIAEADNPFEVIVRTIQNFTEKVKKAVDDFLSGANAEGEDGNFFSRFIASVVESWEKVKTRLKAIWEGLPDWLGRFFKGIWTSITESLSGRAKGEGQVTFFDQLVDEITKYIEPIKDAWAKFKEFITPIIEDIKKFVKRLFSRDISDLGENATLTDTLKTTFQEAVDEGDFQGTITAFDKLKGFFGKVGDKVAEIWETIKNVNWGKVFFQAKATMGIVSLFLGLLTTYNFSSALKKFAKERLGHDTIGTTISKIGGAIAAVASAMYLIGTLQPDQIKEARGSIIAISVALAGLAALMSVMTFFLGRAKVSTAGSEMLKIAGAITIVAAAIFAIGHLYDDGKVFDLGAGIALKIAGALLAFQLVSSLITYFLGSASKFDGAIEIAGAIGILALAVIALGAIEQKWPGLTDKGTNAIFGIALIIGGLQAASALVNKKIGKANKFAGVIAVAASMLLLALAVVVLGAIPLDMLIRGGLAVAGLTFCLVELQKSMATLSKATTNWKQILSQIVSVVLVIAMIATLGQTFKQVEGVDPWTMIAFSVGFAIMAKYLGPAVEALGKLKILAALKGVAALVIIAAGIGLAVAVSSGLIASGADSLSTMLFTFGAVLSSFSSMTGDVSVTNAKNAVGELKTLIVDAAGMVTYQARIDQYASMIGRLGNGLRTFHFATASISLANAVKAHLFADEMKATILVLKDSGIDQFPDMATALTYFGSAIDLFNTAVSGKTLEMPEGFSSENFKTAFEGIADTMPSDETFAIFKDLASTEEGSKGAELAKFAVGINAIKIALQDYGEAAKDLPIEAISLANGKLSELATLTQGMPTATSFSWSFLGLGQVFSSKQSPLVSFAEGVTALSGGLASYVTEANKIDENKIKEANTTITTISNLDPPRKGKFYDFLTGEGTLDTFGKQLAVLGAGFAEYAKAAAGGESGGSVDYSYVSKSVRAIRMLGSVQNDLSPEGGLMGAINGSSGEAFKHLAKNMGDLGKGIAAFCTNLGSTSNFDQAKSAVGVIEGLASIQSTLKETGGLGGLLGGDVHLDQFATEFPKLGTAISSFNNGLKDTTFDDTKIRNVQNYMSRFVNFAERLNDKGLGVGNFSTLATGIKDSVGELVLASNKFTELTGGKFDTESMDAAYTYINKFSDVAAKVKDLNQNGSLSIGGFGKQIKEFFNSLEGAFTEGRGWMSLSFDNEKLQTLTEGIAKPFEAIKGAFESIGSVDTGDGAVGTLSTALDTVLTNGVTALTGSEATFKEAAGSIISGIQNGVLEGSINEQVSTVASKGAGQLQTKGIYSQFVAAGKHLVAGLAEGLGECKPAVEAAKAMAAKVLQAMRDELDIHSPSVKGKQIGAQTVEGYDEGMLGMVDEATKTATNFVDSALGSLGSSEIAAKTAGETAGKTFVKSAQTAAATQGSKNVAGIVGKGVLDIFMGKDPMKVISDSLESSGITAQGLIGAMVGGDPQKVITDALTTVIGSGLPIDVNTILSDVGNIFTGDFDLNTLAQASGIDLGQYNWILDLAKGGLTDKNVTEAAETLADGVGQAVEKAAPETKQAFDRFATPLFDFLKGGDSSAQINKSGRTLAGNFGIGMTDNTAAVTEAAAKLGKEAAGVNGVRSAYTDFVNAGEYLVQGVSIGLGHMDSALTAARTLAARILGEMRSNMRIASPSKITTEYGMYLSEGLALGIEKYGHMANTAAGNVAKLVLATMENTIGNHDFDIGITPVIDSSNVAQYANTLSQYRSEWDSVRDYKARFPAVTRVAESMDVNVNDRYANTMESFRADISDLGDRISSLKVVMDSGTVVGELAPGMDMALGRRANNSTRRIS